MRWLDCYGVRIREAPSRIISIFFGEPGTFLAGAGSAPVTQLNGAGDQCAGGRAAGYLDLAARGRGPNCYQRLWSATISAEPGDPVSGAALPGHWLSPSLVRTGHS